MKIIISLLLLPALLSASTFLERNSKTGVLDTQYSTLKDSSRWTLAVHMNGDPMSPMDYMNFELIYSKKMEYCWLDFFASSSSGTASTYTSMGSDTKESLISGGIGVSYRFRFLQNVIKSNRVFETTGASLAYYGFTENVTGQNYSGGGIKVDYGIHYRSSSKFHFGVRFTYNLGTVFRAELTPGESSSSRSLTLSWTSLAAEIGYYF